MRNHGRYPCCSCWVATRLFHAGLEGAVVLNSVLFLLGGIRFVGSPVERLTLADPTKRVPPRVSMATLR